jgi:hypothetical protein
LGGEQKHICTGTLIRRNAVLTAAHCIYHLSNDELFVTRGRKYELVENYRVTSVVHPGFHFQQFATKDDIALVFLDNCVSGNILFPIIAVGSDQKAPTCAPVNTYGYGRNEIIPQHLFVSDGNMRSLTRGQRFHSDQLCRDAFSYFTLETLFQSVSVTDSLRSLIFDSIDDSLGCYGGDPVAQAHGYPCEGDSGGPVIDADAGILVGVTSFSSEECGTLPNYFTQVGKYSSWIADELQKLLGSCDDDNDLSYLFDGRKLEQVKKARGIPIRKPPQTHPLLELITNTAQEPCAPTMELLDEALQNPSVPTKDIQSLCSAFLICVEEGTAMPAVHITTALLSMFPSEVEDIDQPHITKKGISRLLLCSSGYESFYENWHSEADITFRYMQLETARNECKSTSE